MTLDLDHLKKLCEAATPGKWHHGKWTKCPTDYWQIFCDELEVTPGAAICLEQDAQFIAASRTAIPELIKRVEELEGELERVKPSALVF